MGIYCFSEVLKRTRQSLGLTQEMLCEGICSPQTISRIENGQQKPRKKTSRQLMERMGKEGSRMYAILPISDPKISKDIRNYDDAMRKEKYKAAQKILNIMEEEFWDTSACSQYLLYGKNTIRWKLQQISPENGRELLWEALELTVPSPKQQEISWYPWMDHELLLLYGVADSYYDEGQTQEAISMLKDLYEGIWSGYRMPQAGQTIEYMILNKLMEIYGGLKGYENAIECAQKGIETCRQEQSSIYLVQFLEGNAQNIRRLLKQGETNEYSEETYREASLQAIAIASALGNEKKAKKMTKRYYKHFGNEK